MFFKYVANGDTFIIHYQLSIIRSLLVRQHKQRDKKTGPTGKAGPVGFSGSKLRKLRLPQHP